MELNEPLVKQAMAAGLQQYPEFEAFGPRLVYAELMEGGAFLVRYAERPPQGTPNLWDFQNAVVKTYKALAGEPGADGACGD